MKIRELLNLLSKPSRTNYIVVCSTDYGLGSLLQQALSPIAAIEDVYFYNAKEITREKARQIEVESRLAPRAGSKLSHFFIYNLQDIPSMSVGPLLKAVEEAKYARFIFQTQSLPDKINTLKSRSSVVKLAFLSKKAVLGYMRSRNQDAKTADELDLYDGTLDGTARALRTKDTTAEITREIKKGLRGITSLYRPEILQSQVFSRTLRPILTEEEYTYLSRGDSEDRKKIVLYLSMQRQ